jgi:carboxypeptidase C (cathepsin A)
MWATESSPLRVNGAPAAPRGRAARVALATVAAAGALATLFYAANSGHALRSVSSLANQKTGADWFCGESDFETDYIKLSNKKDDHYFYWFVKSRSSSADTDPLVVWLNGGPGSSSLTGLLVENGPCLVQPDLSVKSNPYAWNNHANVIWLEQPTGVGFSYFNNDDDRDATGDDVGNNMYAFLDGFLDKHPEFVGRPLFLTGESYAGHYIPASAHRIWQKNKAAGLVNATSPHRINLQGVAIGNGDPNLPLQYKYYVKMATENNYNLTLLSDAQIAQMNEDSVECSHRLSTCRPFADGPLGCLEAAIFCGEKMLEPYVGAKRNLYNVLQPCSGDADCSDVDGGAVERFLTSETVTTALAETLQGRVWGAQGDYVNPAFLSSGDWGRSYAKEIAELLNDGLRMLIFAGDADLVCNWLGNRAWTLALEWDGKDAYNAANETAFVVPTDPLNSKGGETKVAGSVWQHENLVFVRIAGAGHLVPTYQPASSFVMIDRFLKGESF